MSDAGAGGTMTGMHGRSLAAAALAASLLALPAAASAKSTTYKIVSFTHTSSSQKAADGYTGRSTVTWSARPGARIRIDQPLPSMTTGLARVPIRGSYSIDVTTAWPAHCAFTAPTGDTVHPAAAPGPVELAVGPDPNNPKKVLVGFLAITASLGNDYLGTECSTSLRGEPNRNDTNSIHVSPSTLRRPKVTLKFAGRTNKDGIAYTWSTKLVLKRVGR